MQVEELINQYKSEMKIDFSTNLHTKSMKSVGESGVASMFVGGKSTFTTGRAQSYPLRNSTILDSGSTDHICNELSHFLNFKSALDGDFLTAGDLKVPILG